MSYEYVQTLLRRAEAFLEASQNSYEKGYWDVACVEAEIAAQLALKALIAKIGLTPPRIHSIRRLMAFLSKTCQLLGEQLTGYVRSNREKLVVLERCREAGQYGSQPVDEEEAQIALRAAKEVIKLVKSLWELGCETA